MERTLGVLREGINPVRDNGRRQPGILGEHFHWELRSKIPGPAEMLITMEWTFSDPCAVWLVQVSPLMGQMSFGSLWMLSSDEGC